MEEIWTLLGLEPTKDVSAIRRAYAQKTRTCHPEEDSAGFLALRKAYQAALAWAEGTEPHAHPPAAAGEREAQEDWDIKAGPASADEGPNPFADHEAIRRFLELYTGKQRGNSKAWLDYFTSGPFLDVMRERRFTALLLEQILQLRSEFPVVPEFAHWLYQVYRFTVRKTGDGVENGSEYVSLQFQPETGAAFEGIEAIYQIVIKTLPPKKAKGSERLIKYSFEDYGKLVLLAEAGVWEETAFAKAGQILDSYAAGNLTDGSRAADSERHPAGIRLIEHFFRRNDLPDELYRIVWTRLSLKTAVMGRDKLLYGGLRERALERLPDVGEADMNFLQLNKDFERCRRTLLRLEESGLPEDWAQAGKETGAFFARPEFQRALRNRRFVEEQLLRYWLNLNIQWGGEHFVEAVRAFYEAHPEAPCAEQVLRRIREMRHVLEVRRRNREDAAAPAPEAPSFQSRAFLRHWLNTAFHEARDPASGRWLRDYLREELPWDPDWSRTLLRAEAGELPAPKPVLRTLDGGVIEVRLHLRYTAFLYDRTPVHRACLDWERAARADTDTLLFLLPITAAPYDQYDAVRRELLRRLADTAAPEECRGVLAACLAGRVCSLPALGEAALAPEWAEDGPWAASLPPESVLPFEVYAEDADHLYGCVWMERMQELTLFEQLPNGRQVLEDGRYTGVPDAESAAALARQLLADVLMPPGIPMEQLANLPEAVYARPDYRVVCRDEDAPAFWSTPTELLGEAVTAIRLEELLYGFAEGRIDRLELSWKGTIPVGEEQGYAPQRSLVFLKGGGGLACLYFDDFRAESYALLEKPSLYGQSREGLESVPFRRGSLSRQVVHRRFATIQQHLGEIFQQVSWPNNVKVMAGGLWVAAVIVSHGRSKYNLDKQLLADFPMERAHNRPDARFYFSMPPASAAWGDGRMEALEVSEGNRIRLQQLLTRFLGGEFSKLRLTWERTAGRRHIVLLQESGRFQMAWIQEDARKVQFHVADVWTYMDIEGKKYPKDTFQGRTVPAYLIHRGAVPLRNALDLLLANLEEPSVVTGTIGEYADEKPRKPRPYEALWQEMVGDGAPAGQR